MLKDENWFYCELCQTQSYTFDCCGNTYCNAGGCDQCKDSIWHEVEAAIERKLYPVNMRVLKRRSPWET